MDYWCFIGGLLSSGEYIYFCKSKSSSDKKKLTLLLHLIYSVTPELTHYGTKLRVKRIRSCLKQDKII